MVIRSVTPDIVTMSLPFARFGILKFGARGTMGKYTFALTAEAGCIPLSNFAVVQMGQQKANSPCVRYSQARHGLPRRFLTREPHPRGP